MVNILRASGDARMSTEGPWEVSTTASGGLASQDEEGLRSALQPRSQQPSIFAGLNQAPDAGAPATYTLRQAPLPTATRPPGSDMSQEQRVAAWTGLPAEHQAILTAATQVPLHPDGRRYFTMPDGQAYSLAPYRNPTTGTLTGLIASRSDGASIYIDAPSAMPAQGSVATAQLVLQPTTQEQEVARQCSPEATPQRSPGAPWLSEEYEAGIIAAADRVLNQPTTQEVARQRSPEATPQRSPGAPWLSAFDASVLAEAAAQAAVRSYNPQDFNGPPLPDGDSVSSQALSNTASAYSFGSGVSAQSAALSASGSQGSGVVPTHNPRTERFRPYPPPSSLSSGSTLVTDAAGNTMLNSRGGVLTVGTQRKQERDSQPATDAAGNTMLNSQGGALTVGAQRQREARHRKAALVHGWQFERVM